MFRRQRVLAIGLITAFLMNAGPALAPYHVLVIEQVFFGSEEAPNAQYVMLRTLAGFQVFVVNQEINVQGPDGTAAADFGTFVALTNPRLDSGVAILMGTPEAEELFGVTMDHVTSGRLISPDGRICFGNFNALPVDCVSFGNYTGTEDPNHAPAPVAGMALVRVSNTGNDTNDFRVAGACPENNSGARGLSCPTPTPTSVASATPSATATATLRPAPPLTDYVCPGDCNRDRTVMVNEVVTGVNIALDRADVESCYQADADRDGNVRVNELVSSVNSILTGCKPLGTRHFSLDPRTSSFTAILSLGPFPNYGFTGYLDLRAGIPNADGIALVDLVDASEYLSIVIPATAGGSDTVICIKPDRSQFPIINAGVIDCDGGTPLGFASTQDHNIGETGRCTGGVNQGNECTGDGDCPNGQCFDVADCVAAGGTVEPASAPHPGTCRGPLQAEQIVTDSGPGAFFIGQNGIFRGLPATTSNETALPCGDEGGETVTNFAFTTGRSDATILNFNDAPGAPFAAESMGANLSCREFDVENSTGTLVLQVPTFDLEIPLVGVVDFISEFHLDD